MEIRKNENQIDLTEYWKIILKRRWVIIGFTCALVFFTGLFSFLATPKFRSTAVLNIEEELSKILSIDEAFGLQTQVRDLRFFNTQVRLLKTRSLSERVVRKMNLSSRPEFQSVFKKKKSLIHSLRDFASLRWLRSRNRPENRAQRAASSVNPYSEIAKTVQRGISVKPIRDTKLLEVSYTSPSPTLSADIVNTVSEEFINFSVEKRFETTQQASDFLGAQIASLRDDLDRKERELQRYGAEKELLFVNDSESAAVNRFADVYDALTQAKLDRISAQTMYRQLRDFNLDSPPQFVDNPIIQQLTTEYTRMKNRYEEQNKIYKPNYPEMQRLKASLDSMKDELQNEINKNVESAEREYRTAQNRENSLQGLLEQQRKEVADMNSNVIQYNNLKIEVENTRKLLDSLVHRQTETRVSSRLEGVRASNITIIDKGEIPRKAISPNKQMNIILAFFMGLFGGVALCFVFEYLDNTIKGTEDIEKLADLPSLGAIPYLSPDGTKGGEKRNGHYLNYKYSYGSQKSTGILPEVREIELINHNFPQISIAEDYRTVRTSLLLSNPDHPPKILVFSSAMPQEGKTSTVANMAVSFAQLDMRVLIIDADLRKPRLHKIFDVNNTNGLSGYLTGKAFLRNVIQKTAIDNVWLIPAGLIPPNPAELLNSKKMKEMIDVVKKGYDIILIDTPPVLAVIDAVIVSPLADGAVFVIRAGKTTRKLFVNAMSEFKRSNSKVLGVLFNELKVGRGDYHYMDYYRYSQSHDYYESEEGLEDDKSE